MKRMKIYGLLMTLVLFGTAVAERAQAQYMPVVFDKRYGEESRFGAMCPVDGDEVVLAGTENGRTVIVWLDREGNVVLSRPLDHFTQINQVVPAGEGQVLVVGQARQAADKSRRNTAVTGCATIIDRTGKTQGNLYAGGEGSALLNGRVLSNGGLLLGGYEAKADGGKAGMIVKAAADGHIQYKYTPAAGAECSVFDVLGSATEYVFAAFSAANGEGTATVVRLDDRGKPFYAAQLPAAGSQVTAMEATADGSLLVTAGSPAGGTLYKLRPEGDIVFAKNIVPAAQGAALDHLFVSRTGQILAGGSGGGRGYYALLRPDGTTLCQGAFPGIVSGVGMNRESGEAVVTTFDAGNGFGSFVRITAAGKPEFEKPLDGCFDRVKINNSNEVLLASTGEGRICMYSPFGERLSDRFVTDNKAAAFAASQLTPTGEVLFLGMDNRLVKAGHGVYISDVKISKPIDGYVTAMFTVTLSGYSTTKEGSPVPVSVKYGTRAVSAKEELNFSPVSGTLSFIPANDNANRYLINQYVEVPVKANDYVEGSKEFQLVLSDIQQSYLIKPVGKGVIEDQLAVVKTVGVQDGIENQQDVTYRLGLFKTNGVPLTNATGSVIVVDGKYGEGTADALDFDMGRTPRVLIPNGQSSAEFNVRTLSDTRYELPKSVVIDFDKIHALSTSNVAFDGSLLSCTGRIADQPAVVTIASLGDHGRRNNNVVSGFFSIELRRASDGALLTNCTGNDITLACSPAADNTAAEGKDYVFTNLHNLRIGGDGRQSAVNLSGIVLYSPDAETKQLGVKIDSVSSPAGAPAIGIAADKSQAGFSIRN